MARKSSSKARRQRDDRAFAEFDEMMRRLAKTTRRVSDAPREEVGQGGVCGSEQIESTATRKSEPATS